MYKPTAVSLALLFLAAVPAHAATFTVNDPTDGADANAGDGVCETAAGNAQCSLRAAIQEANALAGLDNIGFTVTATITAATALPAITESLFIAGPAPAGSVIVDGGDSVALFNYTGTANGDYSVSNLTIRNGRAAEGGGIFFHPSAPSALTLTDVTVTSSQALTGAGGGISLSGSGNELNMAGGAVTANTAGANGGGISASGGSLLRLTDVTVSGNSGVNGGGLALAGSTLELTTSTLSGNTASGDGGGLFIGVALPSASSTAALRSCTLSGNTATNGGGIGAASTNNLASSMVHCTVAGNIATASGGGGGIGVVDPNPTTLNANKFFPADATNPFVNNLVTDNRIGSLNSNAPRSDCRQEFAHTATTGSGNNVSSDTSCGFSGDGNSENVGNCTNGLADNLGPTQTRALLVACIEAIDKAKAASPWTTTTDQRGAPLADGDRAGAADRDIGAYEFGAYGAVKYVTGTYSVDEDAGTLQTQVERYGNVATAGGVDYATNDTCQACTADEGADYADAASSVSWSGGEGGTKNIAVTILDDDLFSDNCNPLTTACDALTEVFQIALSGLTKGSDFGSPTSTLVTINDVEDGALQFADAGPSDVCEADSPSVPDDCPQLTPVGTLTFDVERVGANSANDSVSAQLVYGGQAVIGASCLAGVDYRTSHNSVTWAANNDDPITVTLTICDDAEFETDESLTVDLSAPTNGARLGDPTQFTGTIISQDGATPGQVQLSASSYAVNEADGIVTITVTRTGGNDQSISVDYRTSATGSAGAGTDYTTESGSVSWAGEDSADKTFDIAINNDALREGAETFSVILSNARNNDAATPDPALGTPSSATVTITSEDKMKFAFTQDSWTAIEGSPVTIVVQPAQAVVDGPYTVNYSTTNGSAGSGDYTATTGSLTFNNGETDAKSFTVDTTTDALAEGDETFTVELSVADPGEISAPNPTTVTISEDDVGFQFSAASYTASEAGGTEQVVVSRVGTTTGAVSVDYAISNTGGAAAGSDYTATASGTLDWADGDAADKSIAIAVINDALDEDNESFTLTLSNPSSGAQVLSPSSVAFTITDDDATPTLSITSPSVTEGNGGTATLSFAVALSTPSGRPVMVDFASANGSATAGSDYTPVGGTLTFTPGQTSKTVLVTVAGDTVDEPDETLTVTLANAVNAVLATSVGTGTILDDDTVTTGNETPVVVVTGTGGNISVGAGGGGGAVPGASLLVLLGVLALRARRVVALLVAGLTLVPGLAYAQTTGAPEPRGAATGLSYEFAELRYLTGDAKDPDVGISGFSLAGSRLVNPRTFLTASYAHAETDDLTIQGARGSVDSTSLSVGAGIRRPVEAGIDFTAGISLLYAKAEGQGAFVGSDSDTGLAFDAGLRGFFAPKVEVGVGLSYVAIFDDGNVAANSQLLYHFDPRFALLLGAGYSDSASQFNLGGRLRF